MKFRIGLLRLFGAYFQGEHVLGEPTTVCKLAVLYTQVPWLVVSYLERLRGTGIFFNK